MGQETGISWTDSTFNPWWGCTEVSPGCDNCYAREFAARYGYGWGKGVPRRVFGDKHWNEPLKWNRLAAATGKPWRVFCASMADIMDDEAPVGQRERLWALIDNTPYLTWQLLTKRPQRYQRYLPEKFKHSNVWLGTTAENQDNYDLRMPVLRVESRRRGLVSWISYEPAIGPLSMVAEGGGMPDWIICGGESGANRRPMEQEWAENLRHECESNGVAFFMKQMSALRPDQGKELIPAHLLVHEFPKFGI